MNIKDKYICFRALKSRRKTLVVKKLREIISKEDPNSYQQRNKVFQEVFKKSWYVQISEPIIDVVRVMNYMTRYMYRAPVSITKIVNSNLTNNPKT